MQQTTLEEIKRNLALNLKKARLSKGIAQEKLAFEANVDRTVVSKIERGVTNPSLEILLRLANNLDIKFAELFSPNE